MKPTRKQQSLAVFFDALAHPRRLMLLNILKDAGQRGMAIHHLLNRTKLTPATLSFHLEKLQKGQVLSRKVKGSEVWFAVNHRTLTRLQML